MSTPTKKFEEDYSQTILCQQQEILLTCDMIKAIQPFWFKKPVLA